MSLFTPRRSFTLIELLVVVAILATVAGLVVGRVDWVQDSSQAAASAAGAAQVQGNLQVFKTKNRAWPRGFDSLIDPNGGTPQVALNVFGEVLPSTAVDWLEPTTFSPPAAGPPTNNPAYSLSKLGIDMVMDNDPTVTFPNASATVTRTFSAFDPVDDHFATVIETDGSGNPTRLVANLYPQGIPADVTLVALGVGPNCTAVGTTMATTPVSPATDANTLYSRYIAIFAVYDDGRNAQLKAVVDSTGSVVDEQLRNYAQSSPE